MIDSRLSAIVKAYDIRGLSPQQLTPQCARALGAAFADEVGISRGRGAAVIGHDMRATSPVLVAAVSEGIRSRRADVVDIGLASTDELYAASGQLDLPGVMVTASHNPAEYNGLKLCRAGARPIGFHTGLSAIAEAASRRLDAPAAEPVGGVVARDFLDDYVALLHRLAPVTGRRLRVVVDAGNGMAGHTVPAVFAGLDVDLVPLYFELDGSFPHHEANPLDPSTLVDLQAAVREHRADLGLAFDGDADRCFVVDERGEVVSPSAITALIASRYLDERPGATVLYNAICSKIVPETVQKLGGTAIRTPVGHSLIKAEMGRTGAVFGGEHSGHFYFRDFYLADSGMLAALHVLGALAQTDVSASGLLGVFERYAASGEINSTVLDQDSVIDRLRREYAAYHHDELDGLTVTADTWWFNVRASNTEPLLRLNVEADDRPTMERVRDEVLARIRS
ncbi:phosphomannomutase/phosphoglucomutase [uncultured Aeromicrobium sp.]|uniref:phosphomannomutase/phosphoglucomutase n=1 Tax=uncultured Aeromicrobium sp. TaxID=337820 RepID=UPI0025DF6A9F|nr:phosphomannomutase/phosphoglucomutase [uncultured Aeromicrobium sp.]